MRDFQVYCNFSSEEFEYKMNNDFVCARACAVCTPKKRRHRERRVNLCYRVLCFLTNLVIAVQLLGKRNDDPPPSSTSFN